MFKIGYAAILFISAACASTPYQYLCENQSSVLMGIGFYSCSKLIDIYEGDGFFEDNAQDGKIKLKNESGRIVWISYPNPVLEYQESNSGSFIALIKYNSNDKTYDLVVGDGHAYYSADLHINGDRALFSTTGSLETFRPLVANWLAGWENRYTLTFVQR